MKVRQKPSFTLLQERRYCIKQPLMKHLRHCEEELQYQTAINNAFPSLRGTKQSKHVTGRYEAI